MCRFEKIVNMTINIVQTIKTIFKEPLFYKGFEGFKDRLNYAQNICLTNS